MGITRRTRQQIAAEAVDWFLRFQETAARRAGSRRASVSGCCDLRRTSRNICRCPAHGTWSNVGAGGRPGSRCAGCGCESTSRDRQCRVVSPVASAGARHRQSESAARFSGRKWWCGLAASVVLGIALWVTYLSWQSTMTFQTVVGEQSSFTLQDGSVVFLNTNSKVRVGWLPTERHIELVRGEARFKVAKDARPSVYGCHHDGGGPRPRHGLQRTRRAPQHPGCRVGGTGRGHGCTKRERICNRSAPTTRARRSSAFALRQESVRR